MRIMIYGIAVVVLALLSFLVPCQAGSIKLKWVANTEPDLAGYNVYVGTETGVYGVPVSVGKVTEYAISDLLIDTPYFIALTAFDTTGNESGYSVEVSGLPQDITVPVNPTGVGIDRNPIITININVGAQ